MKPQERHDAIFASRVEPSMKLLLMAVASFLSDNGGRCIAAPETLAEMTGLSRSTVLDLFGKGIAAGYLARIDGGTRAKETRILWDVLAAAESATTRRGGARQTVRTSDPSEHRMPPSGNRTEPSEHRIATVRSSDSNRPNIGPDPDLNRIGSGKGRGDRAHATPPPAPQPPARRPQPDPDDDLSPVCLPDGREVPADLPALLPRLSVREWSALAYNGVPDTRRLLRLTPHDLRHSKGIAGAVAVAVLDELARQRIPAGCFAEQATGPPGRASPSRAGPSTADVLAELGELPPRNAIDTPYEVLR